MLSHGSPQLFWQRRAASAIDVPPPLHHIERTEPSLGQMNRAQHADAGIASDSPSGATGAGSPAVAATLVLARAVSPTSADVSRDMAPTAVTAAISMASGTAQKPRDWILAFVIDPSSPAVSCNRESSADRSAVGRDWPDGTLGDLALMPASVLAPVPADVDLPAERLALLARSPLPPRAQLAGSARTPSSLDGSRVVVARGLRR